MLVEEEVKLPIIITARAAGGGGAFPNLETDCFENCKLITHRKPTLSYRRVNVCEKHTSGRPNVCECSLDLFTAVNYPFVASNAPLLLFIILIPAEVAHEIMLN